MLVKTDDNMKQNQIKDLPKLDAGNYENIFNVYRDEDGMYFYNLLQTIVFPANLPASFFTIYSFRQGDTWPFISFKVYNNPNLWWVILLANGIQDPTKKISPGTSIRIPNFSVVQEIIGQIGRS